MLLPPVAPWIRMPPDCRRRRLRRRRSRTPRRSDAPPTAAAARPRVLEELATREACVSGGRTSVVRHPNTSVYDANIKSAHIPRQGVMGVRARVAAKKPPGPSAGPDNSRSASVRLAGAVGGQGRVAAPGGRRRRGGGRRDGRAGEACGLNRATAWRILTTLESHGLVVSDRATGHWSLGLGARRTSRGRPGRRCVLLRRAPGARAGRPSRPVRRRRSPWSARRVLTYVDEVAPAAIVSASWSGAAGRACTRPRPGRCCWRGRPRRSWRG